MLSEKIREAKKEKGWGLEELAQRANLSKRTVSNILAGHDGIYLDSLVRVVDALELPIAELFMDCKATVGGKTFTELQKENEELAAANNVLKAENEILQKRVDTQAETINLLQMQLLHKEELLAVHNYYIAKSNQKGG